MRNKLIVLLAVVFGLLAAGLSYVYLHNIEKAAENRLYTEVVMAALDIPANTVITSTMLELKPYPTELRNNKEIVDVNAVVGKLSPVAISKGEVLLDNHLIKPGDSTERLSYVVPNGLRAMSIPVTEVTGVANMIKKDDRVDVITVVTGATPGAIPRSVRVLQNIQVLAVGSNFTAAGSATADKPAAPTTITVAVDPQSALRLKMALQGTGVSITLRPAGDKNYPATAPVQLDQL